MNYFIYFTSRVNVSTVREKKVAVVEMWPLEEGRLYRMLSTESQKKTVCALRDSHMQGSRSTEGAHLSNPIP